VHKFVRRIDGLRERLAVPHPLRIPADMPTEKKLTVAVRVGSSMAAAVAIPQHRVGSHSACEGYPARLKCQVATLGALIRRSAEGRSTRYQKLRW
jgi:hypothetical protein